MHLNRAVIGLFEAVIVAFFVLGPTVFVLPLLPFRDGMQKEKDELMQAIAKRIRSELKRIRQAVVSGAAVTNEDNELIERLKKISSFAEKFPVWPFDAQTLRKFAAAFLAPSLTPFIPKIATVILSHLAEYYPLLNGLIEYIKWAN